MNAPLARTLALLAAVGGVAVAGCGGTEPQLEPRFVAVHNALVASGMVQSGAIEHGSLAEGRDHRFVVHLDASRCYTFVALGAERVRDLDVRVRSEAGEELGRDATEDRQAAARVCPDREGDYQVAVHMTRGHGAFVLSTWSAGATPAGGAGPAVASSGTGGTCADPLPLTLGRPVHGDTRRGRSLVGGSCGQGSAPEQVYQVELAKRSQLSVRLQSGFDAVVYVTGQCGSEEAEVGCNDDAERGQTGRSELDVTLEPGAWFVVVDGYQDQAGDYELIVSASELPPLERVCRAAQELVPGQPASGRTTGAPDQFHASCAGGARSPDRVFRIAVPRRSRLRVRQQTDYDGALYVRSGCAEQGSEVACNDDVVDPQHSVVHQVVDEGVHYVYVDGFSGRGQSSSGNFTLAAELAPAAGGGVAGDGCGDAQPAPMGQAFDVDTFEARDDLAGSCGGQGAADVVYRFDARVRSRLRAQLHAAEHTAVMYVRDTCDDAHSEKACTEAPAADPRDRASSIDVVVEPGAHYLVVDGAGPDQFGSAKLEMELSDVGELARSCNRAPLLRPGRVERASTDGRDDAFQGTCAQVGGGPDFVYRLRVRRRSKVSLELSSRFDGVLQLRRDCVDRATEVGCNDDFGDNQHSRVEATLDPGTYYVIVDGFRADQSGDFTLEASVEPS